MSYRYTVTLLGYTPTELLTQVLDALAVRDAATVFAAVERVIDSGQDPRRFVEDLLERLRDLILVASVGSAAEAVLTTSTPEDAATLSRQAASFGPAQLVRAAAVTNSVLTDMVGATSQRIHLEVLCARLLLPESDDTALGTLSRLDRLERRVGVESLADTGAGAGRAVAPVGGVGPSQPTAHPAPAATAPVAPAPAAPAREPATAEQHSFTDDVVPPTSESESAVGASAPLEDAAQGPVDVATDPDVWVAIDSPASASQPPTQPPAPPQGEQTREAAQTANAIAPDLQASPAPQQSGVAPIPLTAGQMRDAWSQVLEILEKQSRAAWTILTTATVVDFDDDVLTLAFPAQGYVEKFRAGGETVDTVRAAIHSVVGIRVRFRAHVLSAEAAAANSTVAPESTAHTPKYGEAVIREMLNAVPIDEENGR